VFGFSILSLKPEEKASYRPSESFGGLFHDPFWGNSPKKKPCIRLRRLSGFFIYIPRLSKLSSVYK
jgi:hypothetical protein